VVFTFELAFKERSNAPFCAVVVLIIIVVAVSLVSLSPRYFS
jgi:CHASE3 domain sensor protein